MHLPARCVLIKRKFGTPAVLKFRYIYIRVSGVTWLRHALRHDALRTSVSNNFVPIRWIGIRAFRRIAIRRIIGQNRPLVLGTPEGWSSQIYEKLEWWAYQTVKEFRWQIQPFWHNTRVTDVRTTEFPLHMTYALQHRPTDARKSE